MPARRVLTESELDALLAQAAREGWTQLALCHPNWRGDDETPRVKALAPTQLAKLTKLPALRSLHLRGLQIGDDGARALAAALPSVPSLTQLDLSDNSIGDDGARALA